MDTVRFWGTVLAVKPRLALAKFGADTNPRCDGYIALMEGTRTIGSNRPVPGRFIVALGAATQLRREIGVGDLLRGEAHPVPTDAHDVPADLYRVGVLRTIARAGDPGTAPLPDPDPPRTDPPLSTDAVLKAPRRPLHPDNLTEDAACERCAYGIVVAVVRLTDPRDYRWGSWQHIPACLGPEDCPHYVPRPANP
ncbi:MAG: hypothetical protein OHK0029_10930 [Armatimonadaceae bacterium]